MGEEDMGAMDQEVKAATGQEDTGQEAMGAMGAGCHE